jgi:enoyl-CoA hydratase/carnithine racemase
MVSTTETGDVRITHEPGVVWVTLNRPHRRNAVNGEVIAGLEAAVRAAHERDARVLVIRGAEGTFSSGADLVHMKHLREADDGGTERFVERLAAVLRLLEQAPFATVAAVEGYAVAGGCEILLACDIVLATTEARIGDRHVENALVPGAGASVRLPRTLPSARARYLLLTGETIDGREAEAWGLVTRAVPAEEFDRALAALVERLRTRSGAAIATIKRMLNQTAGLGIDDGIRVERELLTEYRRSSRDSLEGLEGFQRRAR